MVREEERRLESILAMVCQLISFPISRERDMSLPFIKIWLFFWVIMEAARIPWCRIHWYTPPINHLHLLRWWSWQRDRKDSCLWCSPLSLDCWDFVFWYYRRHWRRCRGRRCVMSKFGVLLISWWFIISVFTYSIILRSIYGLTCSSRSRNCQKGLGFFGSSRNDAAICNSHSLHLDLLWFFMNMCFQGYLCTWY